MTPPLQKPIPTAATSRSCPEPSDARLPPLRVAIVHHWFIRCGGGERFVEYLCHLFPKADIYTLLAAPSGIPPAARSHKITTSFLQKLPGARRHHRFLMPLFPLALEQFDLSDYDLIISSESGPAKGVITPTRACHICYCHTPMRYIWEMSPKYRRTAPLGPVGRAAFSLASHYLRQWDLATASRVDFFAANSNTTATRIQKCYRRSATVIHCPIDTSSFQAPRQPEDFYLVVSRLVSYKRIDLAIAACNALRRNLIIIGDGEESRSLSRLAGPTVKLLGRRSDAEIRNYYSRARALLFPGEEDLGLTPIEAQAAGCPVIAFARGGALETVRASTAGQQHPESRTGVFFHTQDASYLSEAMLEFERESATLKPEACRAQAAQFDVQLFYPRMASYILDCLNLHDRQATGTTSQQ